MRWKVANAVFQGASHSQNRTLCQDAVSVKRTQTTLCVAMSDGAGSAKKSEIGAYNTARIVCDFFLRDFEKIFDLDTNTVRDKLIHSIKTCLGIVAKRMNLPKDDFACTLLAVAVKGDQYIAVHIGDGAIGVIDNYETKVLSYPDNGEFANSTYFITSNSCKSHLRIYKGDINTINAFFLMTDGAGEALYKKKDKVFAPAINIISSWLKDYSEEDVNNLLYINLRELFRTKSNDDCSFAIVQLDKF